MVERKRSKEFPQSDHHFIDDGSHQRTQELLSEVVDAEFECSQSLTDEIGSCLEGVNERSHKVREVRKED